MIKFKKISKKIFYGKYKTGKGYKDMLELLGEKPEREGSPKKRQRGVGQSLKFSKRRVYSQNPKGYL